MSESATPSRESAANVDFDQLSPGKTLRENVALPLRKELKLSRRQADERAMQCLDQVALAGFADVYPHMLPGAMRQRAAIARALALQPGCHQVVSQQ